MTDVSESFLLTDLYQLAMMEAYVANNETETAVFEFFVRKLPDHRNYFMAAGLEQVLKFLEQLRVSADELDWLKKSGRFGQPFLDYLADFSFAGDVHAMPEGTVFFPDEPIIRVTAPLPEAQYVETRIINILQFQTIIASKAARMVTAAGGRDLIDFGLRRAHGAEAGLFAARAAYIAGFSGSATVLADERFGVPIYGTMAHSYIQAHDSEAQAFERFARARPDDLVLLIDTYDTEAGALKVAALAPKLAADGINVKAVRLDSGDLGTLAKHVRAILDKAGLQSVGIIASGGLNEEKIEALVASGAPIDGFGVGSSLTTSSDAPALDCAYKLQEYRGLARRKLSTGKATWPGCKQVWRHYDGSGRAERDILSTHDDHHDGTPLVRHVMKNGSRTAPARALDDIKTHAAGELEMLPETLMKLDREEAYPVVLGNALSELAREVDLRMMSRSKSV